MQNEPASSSQTTFTARLAADQATVRRLADLLAETLDPADAAVAAFEQPNGGFALDVHWRHAPDEDAVRALVASIADEATAAALQFSALAPQDWVGASLAGLSPVIAGRFVVHGAHDRASAAQHRIGIEIEAALAFGTGHHGTTRGCLLALDRLLKRHPLGPQSRVLDLGTGTGVLAIAGAKALGARVLASDIDPVAVRVAHDNARRNGAGSLVETVCAAGLDNARIRIGAPFDLIFANILLGPLRRLAAPLSRHLASGGHVVLSGLLIEHGPSAIASYRNQGLALVHRIVLGEWVTLVLVKP